MKWYMAWTGERALTGADAPKASQVRKIISVKWPVRQAARVILTALSQMNAPGAAAAASRVELTHPKEGCNDFPL
jgi:hypothetical protein